MTSLGLPSSPDRRRAEEFARLLDGTAVTSDPALAPLAQLASALRELPLGPTPDFRDSLRQRLVAVATVQGVGPVATAPAVGPATVRPRVARPAAAGIGATVTAWAEGWRVRRRLTLATAAMSTIVIVGGIGLAGNRSLPGDPFYGVKRGVESLQLATAGSTEAKGVRHLQFARERLSEVNALAGSPASLGLAGTSGTHAAPAALGGSLSERIRGTLADMDEETLAGTRALTQVYEESRDRRPLETLRLFTEQQRGDLSEVLPSLPDDVSARAELSLTLVDEVGDRVVDLIQAEECTERCDPSGATEADDDAEPQRPEETCVCPTPQATGGTSNGDEPGPEPTRSADPGRTPQPDPSGGNGGPEPSPTPTPKPSPTPSSLEEQLDDLINDLPLPGPSVPVPDLPGPDLPPLPLPTIRLPR